MQDLNDFDQEKDLDALTKKSLNKEVPLRCKYCNKQYKFTKCFKIHEKKCFEKSTLLTTKEIGAKDCQTHSCTICGKIFKNEKTLEKHKVVHIDKRSLWCNLCMESFPTRKDKELHRVSVHNAKSKKKCKICPNVRFETEEEYFLHVAEEHKGQSCDYYICSDCGKQFKTRTEIVHHNNSKCGTIKLFTCNVCNQKLMTAGSLHNHMLRHTGKWRKMCDYCGKMFVTIGQLKVHERTHTREKAFVCEVCGKGFCHRQSLITHSTLHTGIKPFQCENCGNSFSCVGNLIKHRKTHSDTCGETPLTAHRVVNPLTKLKVKINTPDSSKLKALKKEKELQEKLATCKERLKNNKPENNLWLNQSTRGSNQNCSQEDFNKNDDTIVKSETELTVENFSSYVSQDSPKPSEFFEIKSEKIEENYDDSFNKTENELTNTKSESETEFLTKWNCITEATFDIANTFSFNNFLLNASYVPKINQEISRDESIDKSKEHPNISGSDQDTINILVDNCNKNNDILEVNNGKPNSSIDAKKTRTQSKPRRSLKRSSCPELKCVYCNKVYYNKQCLLRHEQEHEFKSKNPSSNNKIKDRKICCYCKEQFSSLEECKIHRRKEHADILTCQLCDKVFANVDSLRSHQKIRHKGMPRKTYIYVCEKCGVQFRQRALLNHHEENGCGTKAAFSCEVCGKTFNNIHTCKTHLKIHDPTKKFLCKFCSKSFRWKGQVKVHERRHTGEKPFKCLYCPKAFCHRESLVTHSSLHTGIKPHLCRACGSRFSCIGNLIKHRASHASTCGAWYSQPD